jgi:hypothetical protein
MLRSVLYFVLVGVVLSACKDQTPEITQNPPPPPEPSIHIIDNYYYAQFTWTKQGDTHTYEVLDDTLTWTDSSFVNVVYDARSEEVYDTVGAAEKLIEPDKRLKIGWHYAPSTSMITNLLYGYRNAPLGEEPALEELVDATRDIFTISFPWSNKDTLAFWDIQDYLDHPVVEKGQIKWGRIGNNVLSDTIWNQDAREGVVISYIDTAGVEWRSDFWPTFQPFGYFVITDMQPNLRDGESYDIITGEFAVRLYNKYQQWRDMRYGKFRMRLYSDIELGPEPQ